MSNKVREILLTEARERWVAIRTMIHATPAEQQLADVMIAECTAMLRELSAPPEADPEAEAEVQRQAEDHARNHRERAMTGGAETERRLVRRGMA